MTTEEKFRAAVNVIKNLPKNGSYQPSHELMLRFYAYFKQATEGPCKAHKPAFWEVVKKMKWESWNRLGNMPREEAMENYVEELKKIVETMSYTDNVASFLGSLGSFYDNVPLEDLELLVGPVLDRIRSQPGSPLGGSPLDGSPYGSREPSPARAAAASAASAQRVVSSLETSPASSYSASPLPPEDDDDDEDEFKDTLESTPLGREIMTPVSSSPPKKTAVRVANGHGPPVALVNGVNGMNGVNGVNGHLSDGEEPSGRGRAPPRASPRGLPHTDFVVPQASAFFLAAPAGATANGGGRAALSSGAVPDIAGDVAAAVARMQTDLAQAMGRLGALERAVLSRDARQSGVGAAGARVPRWWPLRDISPRTFALLTLWPLVLHLALAWLQRRRRALHRS